MLETSRSSNLATTHQGITKLIKTLLNFYLQIRYKLVTKKPIIKLLYIE
jgi:hypothetical protein